MDKESQKEVPGMSSTPIPSQRDRSRHRRYRMRRLSLWHRFVLLVGYAAIAYALVRGIVYVLVLLEGVV